MGRLHPGRAALSPIGSALLLAAALAAPAPLPGPDGALWLGPLTPDSAAVLTEGRGTVTVEPRAGELWVEHVDLRVPGLGPSLDVRRTWDGTRWWWPWQAHLEVDDEAVRLVLPAGTLEAAGDEPQVDGAWPTGATFSGPELRIILEEDGWVVERSELPEHGLTPLPGAGVLSERYDADGRLVERLDDYDQGWWVTWEDGSARQLQARDGRTVSLHNDAAGHLSLVQCAGEELYYDHQDGRLVAYASSRSPRTRFAYREDGALRGIYWPDGSVMRATFDDAGRVQELVGPGPRRSSFTWDPGQVSVRDQVGRLLRVERSTVGDEERITITAPGGLVTRSTWREGSLVALEDPKGRSWRVVRDGGGRPTRLEGAGITWRLSWSDTGLIGLTDPAGGTWAWGRDLAGRATSWTDPEGRRTTLVRGPNGQVTGLERGGYTTRVARDASGRVRGFEAATGSRTTVRRDGLGRVLGVADPSGNELVLSGHRGLRAQNLVTRTGASWRVGLDLLGRLERIESPYDGVLAVARAGLGRMAWLGEPTGAGTRFDWRSDDRPTRIVDARGGETGLRYDPAGRLAAIRRADQSELTLARDPTGEVVELGFGDVVVAIARDVLGRPLEVGPLRYAWSALGDLLAVRSPTVDVELVRSGSGRVRQARVGEQTWRLERDASGRVVAVHDGDDRVELQRSPAGQITRVDDGTRKVRIERDERGHPTRIALDASTWRSLRDAEGRVLRWTGPEGITMSADRDESGAVTLVHYPDGSSRRDGRDVGERSSVLLDPGGRPLLEQQIVHDILGEPIRLVEGEGLRVRRGPLGDVVALEADDGTGWSWTPGQLESTSDGALVAYDGEGRPFEALPPVGPAAWGIAVDSLSWLRDDAGAVTTLLGDAAALVLGHDALGRLVSVESEAGERIELSWDAFGRLVRIEDGRGTVDLVHGLDRVLGQAVDEVTSWFVSEPGWGWASTDPARFTLAADLHGHPRVVLDARTLAAERVQWTPVGLPDQGWSFPFGFGGAWSLYSAGPLLDGQGAWDPVSGTRTGGDWRPPWVPREHQPGGFPELDGSSEPWWSPDVWAPESAWSDPLELMVSLQVLAPAVEGTWIELGEASPALPWLPASTAGGAAPLGVPEGALPFDHEPDPLVLTALRAGYHGGEAVDEERLIRLVLDPELEGAPSLELLGEEEPWRRPLGLVR